MIDNILEQPRATGAKPVRLSETIGASAADTLLRTDGIHPHLSAFDFDFLNLYLTNHSQCRFESRQGFAGYTVLPKEVVVSTLKTPRAVARRYVEFLDGLIDRVATNPHNARSHYSTKRTGAKENKATSLKLILKPEVCYELVRRALARVEAEVFEERHDRKVPDVIKRSADASAEINTRIIRSNFHAALDVLTQGHQKGTIDAQQLAQQVLMLCRALKNPTPTYKTSKSGRVFCIGGGVQQLMNRELPVRDTLMRGLRVWKCDLQASQLAIFAHLTDWKELDAILRNEDPWAKIMLDFDRKKGVVKVVVYSTIFGQKEIILGRNLKTPARSIEFLAEMLDRRNAVYSRLKDAGRSEEDARSEFAVLVQRIERDVMMEAYRAIDAIPGVNVLLDMHDGLYLHMPAGAQHQQAVDRINAAVNNKLDALGIPSRLTWEPLETVGARVPNRTV